jgi:hypothetical protein
MMLPILLAAALGAGEPSATCSPGPAVNAASVRSVTRVGDLNRYVLGIQVTNAGNSAQPSNTLQSVDVIQNEGKIDQKGVPPLRPGQSYTATYTFTRSVEAADGTTQFVFRIRDCSYAFSA